MLQKNEKKRFCFWKKHSHSKCVSYCTWPEPQKIWVNFSQKMQSCLCGFLEYHLLQSPLLPWQRSGVLSANREEYFLSVLLLQSGHYDLFGNKQERKQPQQTPLHAQPCFPHPERTWNIWEVSVVQKNSYKVTQLPSEEQTVTTTLHPAEKHWGITKSFKSPDYTTGPRYVWYNTLDKCMAEEDAASTQS